MPCICGQPELACMQRGGQFLAGLDGPDTQAGEVCMKVVWGSGVTR